MLKTTIWNIQLNLWHLIFYCTFAYLPKNPMPNIIAIIIITKLFKECNIKLNLVYYLIK